ncbi:MAG: mechanosensitive ion channel protein MscS [Halobacteriovoraceae bacterium]|nr:mechanosensitive ion channel protein MscS [Halobacteriovoraceae bacterium]|tara:strand:- start:30924 stop:31793 length:870 start_codon:yes stop_codon:yes gene_type:complete
MVENLFNALNLVDKLLSEKLFEINETSFTSYRVLSLLLSSAFLLWLGKNSQRFVFRVLQRKSNMSAGSRYVIATLSKHIIHIIGFYAILLNAGFDFKTLTVVIGALGVGIGFGLQHIINNFVSGIVILFERPISVGDRVVVEGVEGDVVEINARATKVKTNDNIMHIIPNGDFVTKKVINWSHGGATVRSRIAVSVAYGEDPEQVKSALIEVANENNHVLQSPKPDVLFIEFGDSSLNFELRVWTQSHINRPGILKSDLNYAIARKFDELGIEVPYPQRDIYVKELPSG